MSAAFENAFAGKSVFVTGHTGFKGSWLSLWLNRLGAKVTGYALAPPTDPSLFDDANVEDVLHGHHVADIRDQARLHEAMQRAEPDLVLHLAAQSVVRRSYEIPFETFEVNAMGTASVLEGVRKLDRKCSVVCVTSDKCYENREQIWGYRENDPMGEHDPYGGSKGAAELVIRSYRDSFFPPERYAEHGIKLASARAGNVIGGGDWTADALVVDVVRAMTRNEPVELRSPNAYRPWQHVLQALSGYLRLAERLLASDDPALQSGFNIGPLPGNELSVREVVEVLLEEWGRGIWIDVSNQEHPRESTLLYLAIDKAMWTLDWRPSWTTREALQRTAQWYRNYVADPTSARRSCEEQIAEYESAMFGLPKPIERPALV